MDISSLQPNVKAADLPFEKLAANSHVSEADKVKEACRQFEAVLMRQILTEARKTVISSDDKGDSSTKGIYDDMINNQLADTMTRSGGLGLAKSLQAQLVHQTVKSPNSVPAVSQSANGIKGTGTFSNSKTKISSALNSSRSPRPTTAIKP